MAVHHVSVTGDDGNDGSETHPLHTIGKAAAIACLGDIVVVHAGEYRGWGDPMRGGTSEAERIEYRGVPGKPRPVIKGSELVETWERCEQHPGIWVARVPNGVFGDFNPFVTEIFGDWLVRPDGKAGHERHLRDIYLNGRSVCEVGSVEEVCGTVPWTRATDDALGIEVDVLGMYQINVLWHAEVCEECTVVWAGLGGFDPASDIVEISMRKACFFPTRNHIDYVTVRGFEMAQASGDWAPATSMQWGVVGPNWARGWIIEDNELHDAKFSAVSLGKIRTGGDNDAARYERKTGYQYQLEAVLACEREGWRRDLVGSHVVRGNGINDCGQNAIVGHMGCMSSRAEHNDIHHIGVKREFFGGEVVGIKFHAATDTTIAHNYIHDCSLGIWLDWQAQGTRVSANAVHGNVCDMMVEVSHGPFLVDDNMFLSPVTIQDYSQGGAFVHNLIAGTLDLHTVPDRSTPCHVPHGTLVAGCAMVPGGDDRYVNNLFLGAAAIDDVASLGVPGVGEYGLASYAEHPCLIREYIDRRTAMWNDPAAAGDERSPLQLLYSAGNVRIAGCRASGRPHECCMPDAPYFMGMKAQNRELDTSIATVRLEDADGDVIVVMNVDAALAATMVSKVDSGVLGVPRIVDERFELFDGLLHRFDKGIDGRERAAECASGPFGSLNEGKSRFKVWSAS